MRFTLPSLFLLLLIALVSFDSKQSRKLFVPPGTVPVNDTLYFEKTEVSIKEWRLYEDWQRVHHGDSSAEYKQTLPDSLVWREALSNDDTYKESYPKFKDHPVVGISYEQAVDFCRWRTEVIAMQMKSNVYNKKILPQSFNYRLPSKAEWEEAAKAGYSEKTLKQINKKRWEGFHLYNVIYASYDSTSTYTGNPEATITAPGESYSPNKLGIYNLFGNVSEMIAEQGIYKGGGWNDKASELKAEKDYPYEKPRASLGFRCACVAHWN